MPVTFDDRGFDRFLPKIPTALDDGAKQGAEAVVELAKQRVPVDTGALKASIQAKKVAGEWEVSAGEGLPDNRAFHVEFGTIDMAAQPYLTPAARDAAILDAIADEVKRKLMG
jgi:HK97 gp10 family phage protein